MSKNIFTVCLESTHMNMIAHKIASILRTGKVNKVVFATVDGSPHCIQLHYIRNELKKIMNLKKIKLENYISNNGNLVLIDKEKISKSKKLVN